MEKPRDSVISMASAEAWRTATSSVGAISTTLTFSEPPSDKAGVTLAMMVESGSSGSEKPKILIAPPRSSEKGNAIWPTPQTGESSGTSW